jgi:fatty acid-binding protein DegV
MLGIKPFLTIEEGRLIATEKIRTRVQAVERIVEFATEFEDIQDAVIVQYKHGITEQTRMLQERLAVEFPGREFPYTQYSPAMAALIGIDASGFVLLEEEVDDHDF